MPQTQWIPFDQLEAFMTDVFKAIGVPEQDARVCADVLITIRNEQNLTQYKFPFE
jgi:LDH2 family malate/lactate/ureidoglycolate dehydrogenase